VASHFQQARTETISGAGHWLHHEKPDEVLRAIRTFLGLTAEDSLTPRAAAAAQGAPSSATARSLRLRVGIGRDCGACIGTSFGRVAFTVGSL
jgi:hypothetical protein